MSEVLEAQKFELTLEQTQRVLEWEKEQDAKAAEAQTAMYEQQMSNGTFNETDRWKYNMSKEGIPYFGACGGALSYSFTPTSLGIIEAVRHAGTKESLNLTDYESW